MSTKRGSCKRQDTGPGFKFPQHVAKLAAAQEAFAWHMLKACLKTSGNTETICFSPLSLHKSLSMVYSGSRYESAQQLKQLLRIFLLDSDAALNLAYADVTSFYSERPKEDGVEVFLASKVFAPITYCTLDHFGASLRRFYGQEIAKVPFATDRQLAAKEMDQWLEEESGQSVLNLLRPKALGTRVSVVAASVVIFSIKLAKNFIRDPRPMVFAEGPTVPVVHAVSTFRFAALEELKCCVLEVPLMSANLEMLLILPDHTDKLEELSDCICALDSPLATIRARMHKTRAKVVLPHISTDSSISMRRAVEALGVKHPLDPTTADLSGITGNNTLHLSHVEHRVKMDVDASGTKSSGNPPAPSGLPAVFPVAEILPSKNQCLIANGPFLFVVSDRLTNMILFLGVIRSPDTKDGVHDN